jgi:hypothetical protein
MARNAEQTKEIVVALANTGNSPSSFNAGCDVDLQKIFLDGGVRTGPCVTTFLKGAN